MKYSAIIAPAEFGVTTAVLQGTAEEMIRRAAELGFDGVQLTMGSPEEQDIPQMREWLNQQGLCVTALATGRMYTVDGLSMGCGEEAGRRAAVERLYRLTDAAHELGNAALIIGACRGLTSDAPTRERYMEQFERSLREVAEYAEPLGVPVIFEVIDHLESDAFYEIGPTRELVRRIGRSNLHIYLDTMHLYYEKEDIPAVMRRLGAEVPQVDLSGESRLTPMDSCMDFPAILAALKESGFDGTLAFEMDPATHEDAAGESLRYVKEVWERG